MPLYIAKIRRSLSTAKLLTAIAHPKIPLHHQGDSTAPSRGLGEQAPRLPDDCFGVAAPPAMT